MATNRISFIAITVVGSFVILFCFYILQQNQHMERKKAVRICITVLLIFYTVGLIGLTIPTYKLLFSQLTPYNLLLSTFLVFSILKKKEGLQLLPWSIGVFIGGYVIEWIGVHTTYPFGNYHYGKALGLKIDDIPIIIGLNWLLLVYSVRHLLLRLPISHFYKSLLGAMLLCGLDFMLEPFAQTLQLWEWENHIVPLQNYVSWFAIAFVALFSIKRKTVGRYNPIAATLFFIQLIFFSLVNLVH